MASPPTVFLLCLSCCFLTFVAAEESAPQIASGIYIFGDASVDNGNSGNPPGFQTTIADFIASLLGLPRAPPIRNLTEYQKSAAVRTGINYGFAGAGVLPETKLAYDNQTEYWGFQDQIALFADTVTTHLSKMFGPEELKSHLSRSIFLVSFIMNDYIFNFLPPSNGTLSNMTPEVFASAVLDALGVRLTTLYGLGARKFVVNNVFPMGCTPMFANLSEPTAENCNLKINDKVLPYAKRLPSKLKRLKLMNMYDAAFSAADNFAFVAEVKHNLDNGINNTRDACNTPDTHCDDVDHYLFFDDRHTTAAVNHLFAYNCFNGTVCAPNIVQIVGGGTLI